MLDKLMLLTNQCHVKSLSKPTVTKPKSQKYQGWAGLPFLKNHGMLSTVLILNNEMDNYFRFYPNLVVLYISPTSPPGPSVGILTLIISSRGPKYQIKRVMLGLTINNNSTLETWGGELELFMQF